MQSTSHVRPMEFGDILDNAFRIYRANFVTLFLTALLPYAPATLAVSALIAAAGIGNGDAADAAAMAALITFPVTLLGMTLAWGGLAHLVSEAYLGRPVTLEDGLKRGLRRIIPLIVVTVVFFFCLMLGFFFFVVGALMVMAMFFAMYPAVVIEGKGPFAAIGRSRALARGSWMRIMGISLVAGLIAALPSYTIAIANAVNGAADPSLAYTIGVTLVQSVVGVAGWPFSMAVTVLLYYDRRIRTEALDVQLAAERLAEPALV